MEVKIFPTIPHEWVNRRGKSYETQFIYLGFSRYDTHQKVISKFTTDTDHITYSETPCTNTVFSRGYYTEHATVTVYSESPRIWSEELSPGDVHFFVQQPQQTALT
jgi:hypothetical protein